MEPHEKQKDYQTPQIIHELELETRAGSGEVPPEPFDITESEE